MKLYEMQAHKREGLKRKSFFCPCILAKKDCSEKARPDRGTPKKFLLRIKKNPDEMAGINCTDCIDLLPFCKFFSYDV